MPPDFADGVDNEPTYIPGGGLNLIGTQFNVDTSAVQARVSGTWAVGSSIRTINADGTVECEAQVPVFSRNTLDSAGNVGEYTSITIGADGLRLISYYDGFPNYDLKVAHCNDEACSSADLYNLDTIGDVGRYNSIAIGGDGLGLISYFDFTNQDLKVAHCNDLVCSSVVTYTLDNVGDVGTFT